MTKSYKKIFTSDSSVLDIVAFMEQIPYTKYWLEIRKYEESLSEAQRKYYFGVVIDTLLSSETYKGYSKDDLHMLMKIRYLKTDEDILSETQTGDAAESLLRIYRLFQDLTIINSGTGEFEQFLSRIRKGEWESNAISIPLPNEEWELSHLIT